jgi:hypothetical protein
MFPRLTLTSSSTAGYKGKYNTYFNHVLYDTSFVYFLQIYNLLYNGAISKYVVSKHLCGAIIQ